MFEFLNKITGRVPYFEILLSSNNEFYFTLNAGNGEVTLMSEFYKNKQGCLNGIESVRENASVEENFDIRLSKDRKRYFVLKAKNGEIIGTSETYNSLKGMLTGLESVMKSSQNSIIKASV
jgi:uncharacterized protein